MPQLSSVHLTVDSRNVLEFAGHMLFVNRLLQVFFFFHSLTFLLVSSRFVEKQLQLLSGYKTYFHALVQKRRLKVSLGGIERRI
jgi:hypothetical protein